jgi:biotin transport system substrate-specific component
LAGLPVFSNGNTAWTLSRTGGPYILGSTAGYLLGFVAAAYVVGWLAERGWTRNVGLTALAMVIGNLIIYAFGLANLARFFPLQSLFELGVRPFLIGDAIKIAMAVVALPGGWALLDRLGVNPRDASADT